MNKSLLKLFVIAFVLWLSLLVFVVRSANGEPDARHRITAHMYSDLDIVGVAGSYLSAVSRARNPFIEFENVRVPQLAWVLAKAQCETGMDWRNGGTYGGAFGFMHRGYEVDKTGLPNNSSWGRWGGFTFAKKPKYATPHEQVVVYLRINYGGWHRPNGMYRPPSYSQDTGNLCYKYANKVAGKQRLQIRSMSDYLDGFNAALQKQRN